MPKRILIIEPSRTIRTLLTIYFQRAGHLTIALPDYTTARQVIPTFRDEPPNMAFVAVHPTQMQSYRVLGHLRRLRVRVGTTIVALVSQDESTNIQLRFTLQMVGAVTLLKPFRIQDAMALVAPPMLGKDTLREAMQM